jgi:hypothetical protein
VKLEAPHGDQAGGDVSAPTPRWKEPAERVAEAFDADIFLFNSGIDRQTAEAVIDTFRGRNRRDNIFVLLVTSGGDADAAYKIARALQRYYTRFSASIPGYCKSAGTIVATGAHELVIHDHGELGPLDVQMRKPDELWETSSGLTVMEALNTLEQQAYRMLEDCFLSIKGGSGGQVTFKTATEVAVKTVTGLLHPVFEQIDPMHVGEAGRAMNVGSNYGERLGGYGENLKPHALPQLVAGFSSHSFVIDREEAATYFENVREPTPDEELMADALGDAARIPVEQPVWGYITDEIALQGEEVSADEGTDQAENGGRSDGRSEAEVARVAGDAPNPGGSSSAEGQ